MPRARSSPYSLHPAYALEAAAVRNIAERTGKPFDAWVALVKRDGPKSENDRRRWLMDTHKVSTNYAWWIVERAAGRGAAGQYDPVALVEAQYAGPRGAMRPVYDKLLELGLGLGADVKACPCQTMVPLYRKHVFAEIHPATKDRIDLRLVLGDAKEEIRLRRLKGRPVGDRASHVVSLQSPADVDDRVAGWLRAAYEHGAVKQSRVPKGPVKVPPDLAKALAASAKAMATYSTLTPRMQADWTEWIVQAVKPETRAKRVGQAVEKLAAGKKRMY